MRSKSGYSRIRAESGRSPRSFIQGLVLGDVSLNLPPLRRTERRLGESSGVSLGHFLQLVGGIFELIGLATVALGISETRRSFTDRPSLVGRFIGPVKAWIAHLRRKPQAIQASGIASIGVTGRARGEIRMGSWEG